MSDKKVVILNGPPGSGKDTLAQAMIGYGYEQCEFKQPLFEIAMAVSGIDLYKWMLRYNDRTLKEEPWDKLGGLSQREFLIKISEEWVKPTLGSDHFGKLAAVNAGKLTQGYWDVVFSDGGFDEEVVPLVEQFGEENVIIVQLRREGYDFSGDSRNYINPISDKQPCLVLNVIEEAVDDNVWEIIRFIEGLKDGAKEE